MQLLITGGAGLLGQHLIRTAPAPFALTATQRHTPVKGAPATTVDLADHAAVDALFLQVQPALVIHTAYSMASAADIVDATRNIAAACNRFGADLIHMSTDALFDGMRAPYAESALPSPITPYGRWKAEAEAMVSTLVPDAAIVRTSLITQFRPLDPRSAWVANALRNAEPITLFTDELRAPISPHDLAAQLWEIAQLPCKARRGIWHLTGPEFLSRYALGLLVAAHEGLNPAGITPARSDPTVRPRDLRLLTTRAERELRTRAFPIAAAFQRKRE